MREIGCLVRDGQKPWAAQQDLHIPVIFKWLGQWKQFSAEISARNHENGTYLC